MDGDRIYGWLRSLVDPVTRLVEENPRVGWIKSMGGQGSIDRDEISNKDYYIPNLAIYLKMKIPRVG